jgi:hypothetical protein
MFLPQSERPSFAICRNIITKVIRDRVNWK